MPATEPILAWYAVRTKPRHEKQVARHLLARGFDELLPLTRSSRAWGGRASQADLPLFDGYVFCKFDAAHRLPILTTPGVSYIVGTSEGPLPIAPAEIQTLDIMVHSKLPMIPWPVYAPGTPVLIVAGPLRGATGTVVGTNRKCRLVVSISLLQRSISVEIDPQYIEADTTQPIDPSIPFRELLRSA